MHAKNSPPALPDTRLGARPNATDSASEADAGALARSMAKRRRLTLPLRGVDNLLSARM